MTVPFNPAGNAAYAPARLTAVDYPGLVPSAKSVDTIAVGSVLAVAELRQLPERYKSVANFVDVFFTGFQSLQTPGHHPKWQDVNLAAEFPGWRRFGPAEQWLHIRTTNPIESVFSTVRLRHDKTKGSGSRTACLAMVYKLMESASTKWR